MRVEGCEAALHTLLRQLFIQKNCAPRLQPKILGVLEKSSLRYRIVAETHESDSWFEGTPSELMAALRRAQEALTKDDIVAKTAKSLSMQLETVARLWIGQQNICDRLSGILGIPAPKGEKKEKENRAKRDRCASLGPRSRQRLHLSGAIGDNRHPHRHLA